MPLQAPHSDNDLIRFIEAAGESRNTDAKAAMAWDSKDASAGLAKDILAMVNSRDGGVIVIGKSENDRGGFDLIGVSEAQAASFETTKVATWINNYCAPPVELVCYHQEYQGKWFVVIAVAEFSDIPIICTKEYQSQTAQKALLRKGGLYVRTANAESAPVSTIEEWRTLIGVATMKRGDELVKVFQTMLQGQPLLGSSSDDERWKEQREAVLADMEEELGERAGLGRWSFLAWPATFIGERWSEAEELRAIVEKHIVRTREDFPNVRHGCHAREWGICGYDYADAFALTRSGLLVAFRQFREDQMAYRYIWTPLGQNRKPDVPPGKWIEFKTSLAKVIEFFLFLGRFAHEFRPDEELHYEITAGPLSDRLLVTEDHNMRFFNDAYGPCRAKRFYLQKTLSAGQVRGTWEEECATVLMRFFELFEGNQFTRQVIKSWIPRFQNRTFWT